MSIAPYIFVVIALLVAGLILVRVGQRTHRESGLPAGTVLYSDTGHEEAIVEPLVSQRFGLVGKPDYLVEVTSAGRRFTIPVEVKSRKRPPAPSASHVLQLATYCVIVEDLYGQRPPYGYLRYADVTLTIPFTDELRQTVLDAAKTIRQARTADNVRRSHQEPFRCRGCGYLDSCGGEALTTGTMDAHKSE